MPFDKAQVLVISATATEEIYISDDPDTTVNTPPKHQPIHIDRQAAKTPEKPRLSTPAKTQRRGRYLKD